MATTLTGSCLCGGVHYRVCGEILRFYHCHCRRCRKATGTGHATNLMVRTDGVEWLAGASLLGRYRVPEAERFFNQFCTGCGTPLPRWMPDRGMAVVPAGSLDMDPPLQPGARIFWASRAPWSCEGDALPRFSEYPPP